jgi:hypothetical protein
VTLEDILKGKIILVLRKMDRYSRKVIQVVVLVCGKQDSN